MIECGTILNEQPGVDPVELTHFSEWEDTDDVSEFGDLLTAWGETLRLDLTTFEGFDSFEQAVNSIGFDNIWELVFMRILRAGYSIFEGSDFIEIYAFN